MVYGDACASREWLNEKNGWWIISFRVPDFIRIKSETWGKLCFIHFVFYKMTQNRLFDDNGIDMLKVAYVNYNDLLTSVDSEN